MSYRITVSLWFNISGPAIPEAPELGEMPHAVKVMEHYGITYEDSVANPIAESWIFYGCDRAPENPQRWMTVTEEKPSDLARMRPDAVSVR